MNAEGRPPSSRGGMRHGRLLKDAALLAALVAAPLVASLRGTAGGAVELNLGPGDGPYVSGFLPEYQIFERTATHWTTREASIELPLRVSGGPLRLSYRFVRNFAEPGEVSVWLAGRPVDRFATASYFQERSVTVGPVAPSPLILRFSVRAPDADPRGIRLDRVRVDASPASRIRLDGSARYRAALLVAILFILLRGSGWRRAWAAAWTAPWAAFATLELLRDPWLVHRLLTGLPEWLAVLGALGVILGRWLQARSQAPSGNLRLVMAVAAAAFILRAGAMNHPDFYYPDLRSHAQLAEVVRNAGWDFLRDPPRYILKHGVWSRRIGERTYAFPYTPAFHLPFALVPLGYDERITAMKLGAAALTTVPIVAVATLTRGVAGSAFGVLLMLFVPVYAHHLSVTYLAALFGHAVDMSFLAWLSLRLDRLLSPRVWLAAAALTAACELAYVSAVTVLPLFLTLLAVALLVETRQWRRAVAVLGFGLAGSLLALAIYYRHFLGLVFDVAALKAGGAAVVAEGDASPRGFFEALYGTVGRFFDGIYPVLACTGLVLLARRGRGRALLAAWVATFLILVLGRARFPLVFQHPHDVLFLTPLVCLAAGETVSKLFSQGGWMRALGVVVLVALALQGLAMQWQVFSIQLGNAL